MTTMNERTAQIVNDSVKLKKETYANITERKKSLRLKINIYDESIGRLLNELYASESTVKKKELRGRLRIIRELQKLVILELKGLRE